MPTTKDIEKRLLPCPICGSGDVRWATFLGRPYCNKCMLLASEECGTDEATIRAWNDESRWANDAREE